MTDEDILNIIKTDQKMMDVLLHAEKLDLPGWLIGAGFVRNKVWNHLSGRITDGIDGNDIDLVYFDPRENNRARDTELEKKLLLETGMPWEIINAAYGFNSDDRTAHTSATDLIVTWPETVTTLGVTMRDGVLTLVAPCGTDDLIHFIVRPSPKYVDGVERIRERMEKKKWLEKWPQIRVVFND